ncbi:MAG: cytochrome D1 domain-containing protein [Gaiellales bacterium]
MPELYDRTPSYQERRRAVRRRRVALLTILAAMLTASGVLILRTQLDSGTSATAAEATQAATTAKAAATTTGATTTATEAPVTGPEHVGPPSDRTRLRLITTIGGDISPKSVAASGTGLITAQNMMYRHTVTDYSARTMKLIKTIPDSVELAKFGIKGHPGTSQGAPVEADFSPDGMYAYVSNYSMYGAGFGPEGTDDCTMDSGYDESYLYRINMESLKIDNVYKVGVVPKVVKVTPDGKYVLVSNWCSGDLSVISTVAGREVQRIPIGPNPRGIVVSPKGNAAYVAMMGDTKLVRVDLNTWKTRSIEIGAGPRALAFAPQGRYIYATLNSEGNVARLDLWKGDVTRVQTGEAPRSLAMSSDGKALYVVNYNSNTISKLRTRDMKVLQTIDACEHPIGITYDAHLGRVWAACYSGELLVFSDR